MGHHHLAAEETRQHVDVHEEAGAGGDPSRAVEGEPSAGHDHMHVRMMGERRAPGVQHCGDADPGAEALGIGGDGDRRLGRRLHQEAVDHDAGNTRGASHSGGRRPKSAKARSRGKLGAAGQRALWGFQVSAAFAGGRDAGATRPA